MRDLETIGTALTAAETGHLVLATLHTQSAPSTIDRVIDVFAPAQQEQVRMQLASTLQGIVTQTLLPTADRAGRVACLEILFPDDAVRNLIRPGQGRADLLGHADVDAARDADDGARPDRAPERRVVTVESALAVTSRREQLLGMLERSGVSVRPPVPGRPVRVVLSAPGGERVMELRKRKADGRRLARGQGAEAREEAHRPQDRRVPDRRGARSSTTARPSSSRPFASRSSPASSSPGRFATRSRSSSALSRFFELHKLPKKGVRLGISNNRIGVRVFEIEGVADARQLENAIRFRAEEVLPIPLDEAVLD